MKKQLAFLMGVCICVVSCMAMAADFQVNRVKKSSSVKQQEQSGLESVTSNSLLPGVIGLVTNVAALNKQQKELAAECVPTAAEIRWVNDMVKEHAKAAGSTALTMRGSGNQICDSGETYESSVATIGTANLEPCIEVYSGPSDQVMIWNEYPKASVAKYCADGTQDCLDSKKKSKSNIYKVFGGIIFSVEDYTESEVASYTKFMEKMEKCAPEKISARNKEAYTEFLKNTITGAGKTTNTATIWDAVGGLTSGSGALSGIGSLAPSVVQFLEK